MMKITSKRRLAFDSGFKIEEGETEVEFPADLPERELRKLAFYVSNGTLELPKDATLPVFKAPEAPKEDAPADAPDGAKGSKK
jgi:hypothetical protein